MIDRVDKAAFCAFARKRMNRMRAYQRSCVREQVSGLVDN